MLRLLNARTRHDRATPNLARGILLDQWRLPEFDPGMDAVVAEGDGRIVGYGAVFPPGAIAFVEPEHEGQGVGSALLAWVENRARVQGHSTHRQPVGGHNASGHALLDRAGYRLARTVLLMRRSLQDLPPIPVLPSGLTARELDVEGDARALYQSSDRAFSSNADYEPESFEEFVAEHLGSGQLDPALSRVARREDEIVGFALCRRLDDGVGYVDLLSVDRDERRHGLGTFLLASAFAAFAKAGLQEAQLDVASDNPIAVRLYERAGMTVRDRADVFEKPEPGGADVLGEPRGPSLSAESE